MQIFKNSREPITVLSKSDTIDKQLALSGLTFQYDRQGRKVLNNLSFRFQMGEKIALVGQSGSGKITLLKAIHGALGSCPAQTQIDDGPAQTLDLGNVSLSTMLVPQEPE